MADTLHVTTVAIGGHGVLIEGASGQGKSDLALRLIDRGAELVSDDYTVLAVENGRLVARAPATIAGRMEVRGLGIVPMPYRGTAAAALIVRLTDAPERLPAPASRELLGVDLPLLALDPLPASAPIKVEMALQLATGAA